MITAMSS